MPRGEGTYGSQVGRPPKKKKPGDFSKGGRVAKAEGGSLLNNSLLRKPYKGGGSGSGAESSEEEPIVDREYNTLRDWINPLGWDENLENMAEDFVEKWKSSLLYAKRQKKQEQKKRR